jgi:hypothetical protein
MDAWVSNENYVANKDNFFLLKLFNLGTCQIYIGQEMWKPADIYLSH